MALDLEPWSRAAPLDVVGRPLSRRSALEKVTGRAHYAFDVQLPGMLYGVIARSRIPRGRIVSIDTSKAERVEGVRFILTPENFPSLPPQQKPEIPVPRRPAISREVRFVGEEIAAVAAETEESAEEAVRLLEVSYEALPAVLEPEDAVRDGAPQLTWPGNLVGGKPEIYERGNLPEGEAAAEIVLERRYSTEVQHHNPLEPHCCVASWLGEELTVWDSNQGIHAVRDGLAAKLGLAVNRVRVVTEHTGGGFGSKNRDKNYHVIAAVLSRSTGRPVRVSMSRRDEFVASQHRAKARRWIRGGVRRNGTLTFLHHRATGQDGAEPHRTGVAAGSEQTSHLYACANVRTETYQVMTNTQNPVVFRGPIAAEEAFCFEQFIDELAHEIGMDPLEFRLKNYAERDPASGQPYSSKGLRRAYTLGARAFGWHWPRRTRKQSGRKRRGSGLASIILWGENSEQSQVLVVLQPDGTAEVVAGTSEMGCGTETLFAQIAAEELGLPFESVTVSFGDSRTTPYTIDSSYGSRTTMVAGPAIRSAAHEARRQLLELAARESGAPAETLRVERGSIVFGGSPGRSVPVKEIAAKMGRELIVAVGRRHPGMEGHLVQSFAAHFVEVEVDTDTGGVRVLRAVCAHDSGRWINPSLVTSQIHGGFVQGMGMALWEERVMDRRTGAMLNDNMLSYFVPTILDAPEEITVVDAGEPDPSNSIGAKGIGEPPLVCAGAAIANALFDAVGVRVREYPITPDKVLKALATPPRDARP